VQRAFHLLMIAMAVNRRVEWRMNLLIVFVILATCILTAARRGLHEIILRLFCREIKQRGCRNVYMANGLFSTKKNPRRRGFYKQTIKPAVMNRQ